MSAPKVYESGNQRGSPLSQKGEKTWLAKKLQLKLHFPKARQPFVIK